MNLKRIVWKTLELLILQSVINIFVIYILGLIEIDSFYIYNCKTGTFIENIQLILVEILLNFIYLIFPYVIIFILIYWVFEDEITNEKSYSLFNKLKIFINYEKSIAFLHFLSVNLGILLNNFVVSYFLSIENWLFNKAFIYNFISSIIVGILLFSKKAR